MSVKGLSEMKRVLFVCVENAGRSQMAEAFANHYGKGKLVAQSAGIMIAEQVCPAPMLKNVSDWKLEDPKGKPIEEVRKSRDEIEKRVLKLISEQNS